MKIIFTICSNNFLAQAKTLLESVVRHAPDHKVFIGLVDEYRSDIDYGFFSPATVLPVAELGLPHFQRNCSRYNVIELNTSVKPSLFKYLLGAHGQVENIYYLDPDTKLFSNLELLERYLLDYEILLTPHILKPIDLDGLIPEEPVFLNYGVFNLGFIGIRPGSKNVRKFIDWWEVRCVEKCMVRLQEGLFVDQLWINLAPYLFDHVLSLPHFGCNMGPWNAHERRITGASNDSFELNDGSRLIFYHFSGYRFDQADRLSSDPYNRVSLDQRPDLQRLYTDYRVELLKNQIERFSTIKCSFVTR